MGNTAIYISFRAQNKAKIGPNDATVAIVANNANNLPRNLVCIHGPRVVHENETNVGNNDDGDDDTNDT